MFRVLYNLYQGAKRVVSHEGCTSDAFSCNLGLHEGDVISPTLYLFFIDDLLKEVHEKHPGVTLLGPCGSQANKAVAAMQADDFVAVCTSLAEAQDVAATVYNYSQCWRFRLNSAKSAVMHIPATGHSSIADSGIVWNGVPVPVVAEYCYLGLWLHNSCTWECHFNHVMEKVKTRQQSLMRIWKSRHISVEVKRILLLACVRPVIEYGAEVWFPQGSGAQQKWDLLDRIQVDIIKCSMRCGKEHPCSTTLLAEWGIKPMRMWLHERAIQYFFRVQRMASTRLPHQVLYAAWRRGEAAVELPWQKYVHGLLCGYGIDTDAALAGAAQCKAHVKSKIADTHADAVVREASEKSTLLRYVSLVNPRHIERMSFKSPRPFLSTLAGRPSIGVELLMRVRVGCLGVRELTSTWSGRRANPATSCPACGAAVESLSHFLFECPASSEFRAAMLEGIQGVSAECAEKVRVCISWPDAQVRVSRFVSCDFWGGAETTCWVSRCIADYLKKAWLQRNRCLHNGAVLPTVAAPEGREADGDNAMA